jgi:TATA-binding protein-associated factor Taf7
MEQMRRNKAGQETPEEEDYPTPPSDAESQEEADESEEEEQHRLYVTSFKGLISASFADQLGH